MKKYQGVKTLEVLEGADNYNKWIAERIRPYIKSPALEVGAGIGNISDKLTTLKNLTLTDVDPRLVSLLKTKFRKRKKISAELLDISKVPKSKKNKFGTIYSVNVLEHIKDDLKALKNTHSMLKSGGNVVLLVPAKQGLYSKIDEKLGHFRRYEKDELKNKLEKAGFLNIEIFYFNFLGLLSWYVRDKIDGDNEHLKPSHVKLFDVVVPFLKKIEPKNSLPLGISLIAIGKKL